MNILIKTFPMVMALVLTVVLNGCFTVNTPDARAPEVPAAPQFIAGALKVDPPQVTAGKAFTVSMQVTNSGNSAGTYRANLYIDGALTASEDVSIATGATAEVKFSSVLPSPGHHIVGIGSQTLDVTAADSRSKVTVKLDNGVMDGCNPVAEDTSLAVHMVVQNNGGMIKLTAPQGGFTITGIDVAGYIKDSTFYFNNDPVIGKAIWVYGADIAMAEPVRPDFTVSIYDNRRNRLFSGTYKKDLFTTAPAFVSLPVTDTYVNGDFYIEIMPLNLPRLRTVGGWDRDFYQRYVVHEWYYQLCIGFENSNDPQSWISEGGTAIPGYYLSYNWMIRAQGYQQY